jgi:hypothetical protein
VARSEGGQRLDQLSVACSEGGQRLDQLSVARSEGGHAATITKRGVVRACLLRPSTVQGRFGIEVHARKDTSHL